jgi:hypothetical protein
VASLQFTKGTTPCHLQNTLSFAKGTSVISKGTTPCHFQRAQHPVIFKGHLCHFKGNSTSVNFKGHLCHFKGHNTLSFSKGTAPSDFQRASLSFQRAQHLCQFQRAPLSFQRAPRGKGHPCHFQRRKAERIKNHRTWGSFIVFLPYTPPVLVRISLAFMLTLTLPLLHLHC